MNTFSISPPLGLQGENYTKYVTGLKEKISNFKKTEENNKIKMDTVGHWEDPEVTEELED